MSFVDPPRWTSAEFDQQAANALEAFRERRRRESVEEYPRLFDEYATRVERLMNETGNLSELSNDAIEILADSDLLETFRYVAAPPISEDDLKSLADASLAASRLREDPIMVKRILEVVQRSLDVRRFPWVAEQHSPSDADVLIAIMASASLMASQRVQTDRRSLAKAGQEALVKEFLSGIGMTEVETREIESHGDAPERGSFCGEASFGGRKADIILHLDDGRLMPIECKVSNSATNSVKRLNNDAAVKAGQWLEYFGKGQTVPSAVLAGVFKTKNLNEAQDAGLTLFWEHDLDPLRDFILETRQ
ncbi:MAG: XamI family restriction endonuclease [Acidimicrobiaceae bacterium]|nr:XamI family restriction endonuclease [Acidimicrobiaceae bacterium]